MAMLIAYAGEWEYEAALVAAKRVNMPELPWSHTAPRQTETEGLKVAIILGWSPYYAGTSRPQVNWNVWQELGATPEPRGRMNNPPFTSPRPRISNALVQLGVMIMSSDREFTLWPPPGTGLTIDLAHSYFSIPIVGGKAALSRAGGN